MDDKVINLIVIDDSFDSEEKIVSKLRTMGYTARSTRVEDDEDLLDTLDKQTPDLVIYFEGMTSISLKKTIKCLNKDKRTEDCRVIAVNKNEQPDVVSAMRTGAVDATNFANIDHLLLIITREHKSLINARKISTLTRAYNESERRCTSLLDSSRDAIAYIHEGMHIYSNQSYLEMFGIEESHDLEGLPILDIVASEQRDEFKKFLRNYSNNEEVIEKHDTQLLKPNGEEFSGEMEFSPAQIEGEPCIQIIIRKEDINTEELERQLKALSQKDQLTGLFNRQYCIEKLEATIEHAVQGKYTAALMEIHIDNFNEIKNSVGVIESDQYIVAAAKALNKVVGSDDILARYTHDSFTVIANNYSKDNIKNYARKLQKAISQLEIDINGSHINTTCCIGITLIDNESPEYNDILARSEKAITLAIEKGVDQIHIYVPYKGELTRHEVDAKFKEQLTDALKNDKFLLHYQPIVSLHGDETIERYEVFVRLEDNNSEQVIMPLDFLPAAERIGMSIAIDRWVLYRTIQCFIKKQESGKNTQFFIKLSASSIKDATLIDWLNYQIKEKQIPDYTLNFEVKENVAVTNLKNTKNMSHKLKELKCGVVLDDFGVGTNPFQILDHIHADYVRMDSSFMDNLAEHPHNQESIKRIAQQATELGKFTIAQHVPDATSLSILWGMGINFIQGYFLQEPLPTMDYDFTEMSG
jgi:diguanylate cyclase (GGDEF)-like protein/PAS domain S-box-containing protein